MEFKTCEQYVLSKLAEIENENAKLKERLGEEQRAHEIALDAKDGEIKRLLGQIKDYADLFEMLKIRETPCSSITNSTAIVSDSIFSWSDSQYQKAREILDRIAESQQNGNQDGQD